MWTKLTVAEITDEDGQPTALAEIELDMFFVILTLAGSETTRNAITQGMMALLAHPDQLRDLRADPTLTVSADRRDDPMGQPGAVLRPDRRPLTSRSAAHPSAPATA